ncbi:glycoside hydrolase family 2 TIM barrel-domain containing protein [Escherichia coli]
MRGKGFDNVLMVHDHALMDWIGANSYRTSHYPYAEEMLDWADGHWHRGD